MRFGSLLILFIVCAVGFNNCIGDSFFGSVSTDQSDFALEIFSDFVTDFQIHAVYESGAQPYTGSLGILGGDIWDITQQSYISLFQNHSRTIIVPRTPSDMTAIGAQNTASWSSSGLIQLGRSVAPEWVQGTHIHLTIIYVKGFYEGNANILGIQFSGTPFAFVFKDAIVAAGGTTTEQYYAEQAVTVHELGHVVGLVNLGVPMVSAHEDGAHRGHANNSNCVMYWTVESAQDILSLVAQSIGTSQKDLFGPESLQDGRSFHP